MILREDGEVVDPDVQVHIPNLPQQQGVADCGVYAIAYAFHAARRDSLEDIGFEQDNTHKGVFVSHRTHGFHTRK